VLVIGAVIHNDVDTFGIQMNELVLQLHRLRQFRLRTNLLLALIP